MAVETSDSRTQEVYEKVKNDLLSIYKKRRITGIFQKLMWLIFGLYLIGMVLFMLSQFFSFDLGFISEYTKGFENTDENPYKRLYPFIGLFVFIYIITFVFSYLFRKYKTDEAAVFVKMTKDLFPRGEFTHVTQVPVNKVNESSLFPWIKSGTPVSTYGQMRTIVNGIKIQIADIGFIEESVGSKLNNILLRIPFLNMFAIFYQYILKNIFTSKSADNIHFTFRGMYSWTTFNKPLKGHTIVIPNTFAAKADRLASFKLKEEERVILEDVRFTNQFLTYASDQVEARYVLSTKMMEKVVELKERFGRDIMLSFKNNKLFVAVENPNGLFSLPSGKLDSIHVIEEIIKDIEAVESIVEEFDLNDKF